MRRSVHETGVKVESRYRDLACEVLAPYSQSFLVRSGLRPGMRVLEVGCGSGAMTPWLAQKVGLSGRVVALDINAQEIETARRKVQELGLDNVEFTTCSAENIKGFGRDFDLIYGRFILMQLANPFEIVEQLVSCLKPGGIIALDEPNQAADLAVPPCPPIERANALFLKFSERAGMNFGIGDRLYPMLRRLGLHIRVAHTCQPIIPVEDALLMFKHGLLDSRRPLLDMGVGDGETFEDILQGLDRWPVHPGDFYALSRQVQVSGEKLKA